MLSRIQQSTVLALVLLIFSCIEQPATASTVTLDFTGKVSEINDPLNYVPGLFQIGESIRGFVTYDTDASPQVASSTATIYQNVESMSVTVGAYTWSATSGQLQVWNGQIVGNTPENAAIFESGFVNSVAVPNTRMLDPLGLAGAYFISSNLSTPWSSQIPTAQQVQGLFGPGSFIDVQQDDIREIGTSTPMNFAVYGEITSVAPVPIPASWILLASSVLGGAIFRKKRAA